jgi:bifunctional DNA-binding transcriptional regulator/antitoxin component of YhaV-PrlF toxin-antitoxin module
MDRIKPTRRRGFTRLSSRHQVTLPLAVVRQLELEPGDELRVEADGAGRIVLSRPKTTADERRAAIAEVAGTLPGVWEPGDLNRLRDEWQ